MQVSNSFFRFKQFVIHQDKCTMKVTTDGCLFGAWCAEQARSMKHDVKNVLDIGAGTGLLSLMLAQECDATIDAIEIDKTAAAQAKENIVQSPFADRINIQCADILVCSFTKNYDVIISNPPFYEKELKSDNPDKNVAHHNDGLLLKDLLQIIKNNLSPAGKFCLLLPYKRKEEAEKMIADAGLFINHTTLVRQSVNHGYFRLMICGGLIPEKTVSDEISICKEDNNYTDKFTELLKGFYLKL